MEKVMKRICKKCIVSKPLEPKFTKRADSGTYRWECKECESLYQATYYKEQTEKVKLKHAKYRKDNVEKEKARHAKYRKENSGQFAKWFKENPDKCKAYHHKRRACKNGNGGSFSAEEWQNLKLRYNHTCLACNKSEPEIKLTADHVMPLILGGTSDISNIQPLCKSCNSSKRTKNTDYRLTYE